MSKILVLNLLVLLLILASNFFSYAYWNPTLGGQIRHLLLLLMGFYVVFKGSLFKTKYKKFDYIIWGLFLLTFPSSILGMIKTGFAQFSTSIFFSLCFILFYFLKQFKITEREVMIVFTLIAIIVVGIQIFQQFFPNQAIFGIYDENVTWDNGNIAEIRNGLYRYRISTTMLTLLCLYYYWGRVIKHKRIIDFLLVLLLFVSVYLTLTRQLIFITIFTIGISYVFASKKIRIQYLLLILLLGVVLYANEDILLGELLKSTSTQIRSDDIRMLAFSYYLKQIFASLISFVFGYGHISEARIGENFGFWATDIGIIGEIYFYGVLWGLLYLYQMYYFYTNRKYLPLYIKLFLFATFLDSIMIFPYSNEFGALIWASMFYLSSLYITKNGIKRKYYTR